MVVQERVHVGISRCSTRVRLSACAEYVRVCCMNYVCVCERERTKEEKSCGQYIYIRFARKLKFCF